MPIQNVGPAHWTESNIHARSEEWTAYSPTQVQLTQPDDEVMAGTESDCCSSQANGVCGPSSLFQHPSASVGSCNVAEPAGLNSPPFM